MADFILVLAIVGFYSLTYVDSRIVAEVEPAVVQLPSLNSSLVNISCRVHQQTPVRKIFSLQILKKHRVGDNFTPIAEFEPDGPPGPAHFVQKIPRDIPERFRVFGYQSPFLVDSFIRLQTNSSVMFGRDGGPYLCKLVYQSNTSNIVTTVDETILKVVSSENYRYSKGGIPRNKQGTCGVIVMFIAAIFVKITYE